jgi:hypothetical protein
MSTDKNPKTIYRDGLSTKTKKPENQRRSPVSGFGKYGITF